MTLLDAKIAEVLGRALTRKVGKNGIVYYYVEEVLDQIRTGTNTMEAGRRKSFSTFLEKHDELLNGIKVRYKVPTPLHYILEGKNAYNGIWISEHILLPFLIWMDQRFLYEINKWFLQFTSVDEPNEPLVYKVSAVAGIIGKTTNEIWKFLQDNEFVHYTSNKEFIPSVALRKGNLAYTQDKELVFTKAGLDWLRLNLLAYELSNTYRASR